MCHSRAFRASLVGWAKSPLAVVTPRKILVGDFAHAVHPTRSLNSIGRRPRGQTRTRSHPLAHFCEARLLTLRRSHYSLASFGIISEEKSASERCAWASVMVPRKR